MNVLIPANWILQPFFSRISEGCFNLRAHIGFADSPIEMRHEDHCRYLLQQCAVFVLKVWRIRRRRLRVFMETVEDRINGRVGKYSSEIEKDRFRFGNIR